MRLGIIIILVIIINMLDTLAYGARIAGVKTKSPTMAASLFNLLALVSRIANLIQLPLLAVLVDRAIAANAQDALLPVFRVVILANSVGTLLGIFLIPTFVNVIMQGIYALEKFGSVPSAFVGGLKGGVFRKAMHSFRLPAKRHLHLLNINGLPKYFLVANLLLTAIYSVGILAAIYAGCLVPEYRLTASNLSGIINGLATIFLVIFVDPVTALLQDQIIQGKREETDLKRAVSLLLGGRFLGSLLAQFLFLPAAHVVVLITYFIS
ncbi:lipid II flippase Amj family protein [Bacillota bacterium LX-D]|nr:lipid II flippase Amj family protein [Bacillota bacterium LX-D]